MQSLSTGALSKSLTGIDGLDQITFGGLPQGRPTLICGSAGCGKTLLAMEFLVHGATQFGEPGVFFAFEETGEELAANVRSLGFDLEKLAEQNKLYVEHIRVERNEIEETGEYDLEGLFIRLGLAIDSIGAKRVVLDTIETLFSGLSNEAILRAELRRLFRWLKDKGVTAVITGERGDGSLTRHGLEEYVSDCVILLDHRVHDQVSTRRLRIVKYRGTVHGTNEYPFLIGEHGISVLPITEMKLDHAASLERLSSGVSRLDSMLGGQGFYRGSTILVSGTAGTGKTSLAAHFADATCRRAERCLYFAFEESRQQITRNMRSIGIELQQWVDDERLRFVATRPTFSGFELHLATMHQSICEFEPQVVIIDPISNLMSAGTLADAKAMLVRLIDFLKAHQITVLMTCLTTGGSALEATEIGISSLVDTWLLLRDIELGGERNRGLYVLKSRGMPHSNQIREFVLTQQGIELQDVYLGPEGVLTGSARVAQEAREVAAEAVHRQEQRRKQRDLELRRKALEAQIAVMQVEMHALQDEANEASDQERLRDERLTLQRDILAHSRQADRLPATDVNGH